MTYHLPGLPWLNDPLRPHSTFHSKTKLRQYETPLTAQLDFLGHAGQVSLERAEAPLARVGGVGGGGAPGAGARGGAGAAPPGGV